MSRDKQIEEMENLNAEQIKYCLELILKSGIGMSRDDVDVTDIKRALALINSQEQRIKELTEENANLHATCTELAHLRVSLEAVVAKEFTCVFGQPHKVSACPINDEIAKAKADTVRKMESLLIDEVFKVARCQLTCDEPNVTDQEVRAIIKRIAKEMLEGENENT